MSVWPFSTREINLFFVPIFCANCSWVMSADQFPLLERGLGGRVLLHHLFAIDDDDAFVLLAYTLAGNIVDSTIVHLVTYIRDT